MAIGDYETICQTGYNIKDILDSFNQNMKAKLGYTLEKEWNEKCPPL